jgi:hypothetical protein
MSTSWSPKGDDPLYALNDQETVYPLDLLDPFPSYQSTLEDTPDLKTLTLQNSFTVLPDHPSKPSSLGSSIDSRQLDQWLLESSKKGMSSSENNHDGYKRSRGVVDDEINACWKSPLCPNRTANGGKPDHCNGECADALFAHPPELPDQDFVSSIMEKSKPKVYIETERQTRLKRADMGSSPDMTSRTISLGSSTKRNTLPLRKDGSRKSSRQSFSLSPTTLSPEEPLSASTSSPSTTDPPKSNKRVPHKQVEKKYRENINAQLDALRRAIPMSKQLTGSADSPDLEDLPMNSRQPSKALILSSATMYIKQLEQENEKLKEQIDALKEQNKTLQSLVKCDDCSLMNYARNWNVRGAI